MTCSRRLPATLASLLAATVIVAGCNTTDTAGTSGKAASPTGRAASDSHSAAQATRSGLSEAQILAADVGKNVIRLQDGRETAIAILMRLHDLGHIRAAAHNESIFLSLTGTTPPPRPLPNTETGEARSFPGYFGPPIDLRPNFSNWQFTFAQVTLSPEGQPLRSLHFFDGQGRAVQQLTIDTPEGIAAFEKILQEFRAKTQTSGIALSPEEPAAPVQPDYEVDVPSLIAAWDAITDVHQFSTAVLAKHDVTRLQALRLAGTERAQRLASPAALSALLKAAAQADIEIMAFVSNSANTQIFTGKINAPTKSANGWLHVSGENDLDLKIREAGIDQIWLVKKPSSIGTLSTVEVYNAKGEVIVQFYSKRAPRKPESDTWRALLAKLPKA